MEYKKPGQIITVNLLIAETKLLPGGGPLPSALFVPVRLRYIYQRAVHVFLYLLQLFTGQATVRFLIAHVALLWFILSGKAKAM